MKKTTTNRPIACLLLTRKLCDRMDLLSESLWHGPPLTGHRQLKYDKHGKKCGEFFGKKMKSWRVKLTYGPETLMEVPIKGEIFQRYALSPVLFVIALIPPTHILWTANLGYEFQFEETINHLLFMDDLKLYSKSGRVLDSLIQTARTFSEDIGMQFGIDK